MLRPSCGCCSLPTSKPPPDQCRLPQSAAETIPLASAVARLRKDNPALAGLFNGGGNLDLRALTPQQYRAIRETDARTLLGLGPKR